MDNYTTRVFDALREFYLDQGAHACFATPMELSEATGIAYHHVKASLGSLLHFGYIAIMDDFGEISTSPEISIDGNYYIFLKTTIKGDDHDQ